jgi:hypothetical protein
MDEVLALVGERLHRRHDAEERGAVGHEARVHARVGECRQDGAAGQVAPRRRVDTSNARQRSQLVCVGVDLRGVGGCVDAGRNDRQCARFL